MMVETAGCERSASLANEELGQECKERVNE